MESPYACANRGSLWDDVKGAWILRNSWGNYWGETADHGLEHGYMYLAYGSNNVGVWSNFLRAPSAIYPLSGSISAIVNNHAIAPPPSSTPAHPMQ